MTSRTRIVPLLGIALLMSPALVSDAGAREDRFPYSIMTPEPGTAARHSVKSTKQARHAKTSRGRVKLLARRPGRGKAVSVRGSSGSVLPTPLPRTTPIPPVRSRIPAARPVPRDPGLTFAPGLRPIPNLPPTGKGPETFQDRAARCAHQAGVYGVPNEKRNVYLGACTM